MRFYGVLANTTTVAAALLVAPRTFTIVDAGTSHDSGTTSDHPASRLRVLIPHALVKEGGYDHRPALFGTHNGGRGGRSLAQNVYYTDNDFCDPNNIDTTGGYPQRDGTTPWPSPYILMVDRGGCSFVQKVRNAQRTGAAGVLIADNMCFCSDQDCADRTGMKPCQTAEPIMADDGSGADVSIPSFLMFKLDAENVKDNLKDNKPVLVEMTWSLPTSNDRVEYELWMTPTDPYSKSFLNSFKQVAKALGDRAYFTPHMYLYDGIRSHCQGPDGSNFCYNLCTNYGRYCAMDPGIDLKHGISGADVVRESLRRLCIWNKYGATDGVGEAWWDYVREFNNRCSDPDFFSNDDCIKDVYKHAKIDGSRINDCIAGSKGTDGDVKNTRLEEEIEAQTQRGVVVIPTAFVNAAVIRGGLTVENVFSSICASFSEATAPEICTICSKSPNVEACVARGYCPASDADSDRRHRKSSMLAPLLNTILMVAIATFTGLTALLAAIAVWLIKKGRDETREHIVGAITAGYVPIVQT